MKAVIMAGGFGTRLGSLSRDTAKALLPVNGRPVIEYALEKLEFLEGLERIYVSTNKKFEPRFLEWLAPTREGIVRTHPRPRFSTALDSLRPKLRLMVEPVLSEPQKFGAVASWRFLIWKERLQDELLLIAGDNLFTFDLGIFLAKARSLQSPCIVLHDVQSPEEAMKFGVCALDPHHKITSFEEKPLLPRSTLVSTGIYYLPARFIRSIEAYLAAGNNRDSPGAFFSWLSGRTDVYGFTPVGRWLDIGSPESYAKAQETFKA